MTEEKFTVEEIIARYDAEIPNQDDDAWKVRCLKDIDRMILNEVLLPHEQPADFDPEAHYEDWGEDSELYIYAPYQDVYTYYLAQRSALSKNDTKRYNTFVTLYNNAMVTFQAAYNRTHRPLKVVPPLYQHRRNR